MKKGNAYIQLVTMDLYGTVEVTSVSYLQKYDTNCAR